MTEQKPSIGADISLKADVTDLYTNNVQIYGSLFEFLLCFGLMSGPNGKVKPLLNLRMSPQHAKAFTEMMKAQLAEFERSFGEINLKNFRVRPTPKPN